MSRARARGSLLKHFVGTGKPAEFHVVNAFNAMSPLLEPNTAFLRQFVSLPEMLRIVKRLPVETVRLDNLSDIKDCDYLKIDVQGGELDVIEGAPRFLRARSASIAR